MIIYIPLDQVDDNPWQTRQAYDDDYIAELAADIRRNGLLQYPAGRAIRNGDVATLDQFDWRQPANGNGLKLADTDVRVQLAIGHNRLRAFRLLAAEDDAYATMPVQIGSYDDQAMARMAWAENAQRKDLTAVEEAKAIQHAMDDFGWTQRQAAEHFGLARTTVANKLRLLQLPDEVQQANQDGRLSERQALALKPLLEIEQLTGKKKWGSAIGTWGEPASATAVVQKAIEEPDSITSDLIREHQRKMLEHAGKTLPGWLAKAKFDDVDGVEQPQCKGCRYRVNQHCLHSPCIDKKLQTWPEMALAAFSAETGIPTSDVPEVFELDYRERDRVLALYEAGERDQMVCRWFVGGAAARPFGGNAFLYSVRLEEDGRAGIALGYTGVVPLAENGGAGEGNRDGGAGEGNRPPHWQRLPSGQLRDRWSKAVSARRKALKKEIVAQVVAYLDANASNDAIALLATLRKTENDALSVASSLWGYFESWEMEQSLTAFVEGSAPVWAALELGAPQLSADDLTRVALGEWYKERRFSVVDDDKANAVAMLQAAQQRADELDEDLAEHVAVALIDARWWYAQNAPGQSPFDESAAGETAVEESLSKRDQILQDPNADIDDVSAAADDLMKEVIDDLVTEGALPAETEIDDYDEFVGAGDG